MAKKPEIVSSPRRNSYHGVEVASSDWKYKDILTVDANGKFAVAANSMATKILGQGQADASGTTGAAAVADEWFDGDIIAIDTYDASQGAVEPASSFVAGDKYAIFRTGSAGSYNWYADVTNGSGGIAQNALVFIKAYGDLRDTLTGQTINRGLFRVADGIALNTGGN